MREPAERTCTKREKLSTAARARIIITDHKAKARAGDASGQGVGGVPDQPDDRRHAGAAQDARSAGEAKQKRLMDVSGSLSFNDIIGLTKKGKAETAAAAEDIVTARTDRVANAARRGETAADNVAWKVGEAATLASA